MKKTIDLPDALHKRAKIIAEQRGMTLDQLVMEGLESVLGRYEKFNAKDTLARLNKGYGLDALPPLPREEIHAR